MRAFILGVAALAACAPAPTASPPPIETAPSARVATASARARAVDAPLPARADFAAALAKVKPGMDATEVEKLLGPPDDVRRRDDPGGITAARTEVVWRYGTDAHLGFATLGTVHLQADERVQYVFGGEGHPPELDISEKELRALLTTIEAVPSYNAPGHPLRLIQAVNALQPLGKDAALAVLAEHLRVASHFEDPGREGVFLILRTLFDPPADTGVFPHMMVGQPSPDFPSDDRDAPRFPVVIVDDIPFVVAHGYSLAGHAEPPETHLAWMRDHAALRARPLAPTATPLTTLRGIVGSARTPLLLALGFRDADRMVFMEQCAKLMEHVIPAAFNASLRPDDALRVFESERAVSLAWSAAKNDYELAAPR